MKIAMLVGGMLRQHSIARSSWNLINSLGVDIYFSTWDTSRDINPGLGICSEQTVSKDQIIQPAVVSIHNEAEINLNSNFRKQMFHWQELSAMLRCDYDALIVTRPDLYFRTNIPVFRQFLSNIEENVVYTLYQNMEENHIDDLMLVLTQPTFLSFINSTDFSVINPDTRCHNWLYAEFKKTANIKLIKGIDNIAICRSTATTTDSYEDLYKKAREWQKGLGFE